MIQNQQKSTENPIAGIKTTGLPNQGGNWWDGTFRTPSGMKGHFNTRPSHCNETFGLNATGLIGSETKLQQPKTSVPLNASPAR